MIRVFGKDTRPRLTPCQDPHPLSCPGTCSERAGGLRKLRSQNTTCGTHQSEMREEQMHGMQSGVSQRCPQSPTPRVKRSGTPGWEAGSLVPGADSACQSPLSASASQPRLSPRSGQGGGWRSCGGRAARRARLPCPRALTQGLLVHLGAPLAFRPSVEAQGIRLHLHASSF